MEASAACKLGLDGRGSLHGPTTPNDFGGENGLLTSEARGGLWTNGNVTINNGNVLFVCESTPISRNVRFSQIVRLVR